MDNKLRPFKIVEAYEKHTSINCLAFDRSGSRIGVGGGSKNLKIFDRDGYELCCSVGGDMYLKDLVYTKGHTMSITSIDWYPYSGVGGRKSGGGKNKSSGGSGGGSGSGGGGSSSSGGGSSSSS